MFNESFDWAQEADLVLIPSTCFDEQLMIKLATKASQMKKGSFLISLTEQLPVVNAKVKEWDPILTVKLAMSWGLTTIHVHKKLTAAARVLGRRNNSIEDDAAAFGIELGEEEQLEMEIEKEAEALGIDIYGKLNDSGFEDEIMKATERTVEEPFIQIRPSQQQIL
jgi:hypothetical protein